MPHVNIGRQRLANQLIAHSILSDPSDIVKWFGAIQAQDYLGALWAIGLRTFNATESAIEQAIANRTIIRTWPMRGTLHFVAAEDVRWMLNLLTPRVLASSASRWKQLELDEATFSKSRKTIVRALQGGKQLEREEMYQVLETARISTAGQRGIHILGRLAQEGVICFGARAGKQHTFTLLDEWIPNTRQMERDAALAELAKRYFTSHGPATLQDFVWWSGLASTDARAALEFAKSQLVQEIIADQTYWLVSSLPTKVKPPTASSYLLPFFDEYLVGYKDRTAVLDPQFVKQTNAGGGMLNPTIVIDGQIVGTWKRTLQKDSVVITPSWFTKPTKSDQHALERAAQQYGTFLGLSAVIV